MDNLLRPARGCIYGLVVAGVVWLLVVRWGRDLCGGRERINKYSGSVAR